MNNNVSMGTLKATITHPLCGCAV